MLSPEAIRQRRENNQIAQLKRENEVLQDGGEADGIVKIGPAGTRLN